MAASAYSGQAGLTGQRGVSDAHDRMVDGLKKVYHECVEPLEKQFLYESFFGSPLRDVDLEAKPQILLIGQYSTGKTSFIKYLLGRGFPGMHIGPEPTTDKFMAIMYSTNEEALIPGQAACVSPDKPWHSLVGFGSGFLSHFAVAEVQSPLLEHITLIDTPGVLSGEKQRLGRDYEFTNVVSFFAQKADVILLLFDAHKLDISDEFKRTIMALNGQDDKVRVILNKADSMTKQQLVRVYGALMWSLGKVFNTPEVKRVYIGSFWDQPCKRPEDLPFFEAEASDLLNDLRALPSNSAIRKVNEFVKRCRLVRVHTLILDHLKSQMPMMGKDKKKKALIEGLADEFNSVHRAYNVPVGDFPDLSEYASALSAMDFNAFPRLNKANTIMLDKLMRALEEDIPALINEYTRNVTVTDPFAMIMEEAPTEVWEWEVKKADKEKFDKVFKTMEIDGAGYADADSVRKMLMKSKLPFDTLSKIWQLCSISNQNGLDADEFAVAMHLSYKCIAGEPVPSDLTPMLVPPSKRLQWEKDFSRRRMNNIRLAAAEANAGVGADPFGTAPKAAAAPVTPPGSRGPPPPRPSTPATVAAVAAAPTSTSSGSQVVAGRGGGDNPFAPTPSTPTAASASMAGPPQASASSNPFAPSSSSSSSSSSASPSGSSATAPPSPSTQRNRPPSPPPSYSTGGNFAGSAPPTLAPSPPPPSNNPFAAASAPPPPAANPFAALAKPAPVPAAKARTIRPKRPQPSPDSEEGQMVEFVKRLMSSGKAGSFTFVRSELSAFRLLKMTVEAREWIGSVLGVVMEPDLAAQLKSGEVLCNLMNVISPGSVGAISKNQQLFHFMQNVSAFLNAAALYGVPRSELFEASDLRPSTLNMNAVVNGIHALAAVAASNGFTPVLVRRLGADFSVQDIAATILNLKQQEDGLVRRATIKLKQSGGQDAGGPLGPPGQATLAALTQEDAANAFAFKLDDVIVQVLERRVDDSFADVIKSSIDEAAPSDASLSAADQEDVEAEVGEILESLY